MNPLRNWIRKISENQTGQIVSAFLLFGALVYLFFQTFDLTLSKSGLDFQLFIQAAKQVVSGNSPYQGMHESPYSSYLYPPVLAFLAIPLTWVPFPFNGIIWYGLSLVSLFGILYLAESFRQTKKFPSISWSCTLPVFLLILIMYVPIQNELKNGQVNLIVLFLCMISLHQYAWNNRLFSAIALALALSIKPLPILILFYFLIRRAWRMIGAAILLMAALFLLPYFTMGNALFSAYQLYFDTMFNVLPAENFPKGTHQIQTTLYDFSAYIFAWRTLAAREILNAVLLLAILLLDLVWVQKHETERNRILAWSVYLLASLWMMPVSEKHHLVLLIPPVYWIGAEALYGNPKYTNHLGLGIVIFFISFILAKTFEEIPLFFLLVGMVFFLTLYMLNLSQHQTKHAC